MCVFVATKEGYNTICQSLNLALKKAWTRVKIYKKKGDVVKLTWSILFYHDKLDILLIEEFSIVLITKHLSCHV